MVRLARSADAPSSLGAQEVGLRRNIFVPVCDRPSVAEPTEAQDRAVMETKSAAIYIEKCGSY